MPPAYGGDEDVEQPGSAHDTVGAARDEEPEPDRYDEPTLDVLGEQADAEAKAGENRPEAGEHRPEARTDSSETSPEGAETGTDPGNTAEPAPAGVGAAATRADGPRLAELREAPHPEVGSERAPGYAHGSDQRGTKPTAGQSVGAGDEPAGQDTAGKGPVNDAAGKDPVDQEETVEKETAQQETAQHETAQQKSAQQKPAQHEADQHGAEQVRVERPDIEQHGGRRPAVAVPDVMILPEPDRNRSRERPTVALPRGPVPGQSRPGQVAAEQSQPALSKLETSTFWLLSEETDESRVRDGSVWPPAQGRGPAGPASRLGVPPRRRDLPRAPRRPVTGLLGLLVLGLAALFFAWVSAGPFWLAVGHGDQGTATVTRCTGDGFDQRCVGQFTADRGSFTVSRVALMGVAADQRDQGAVVPARMVDRQARQAYVGSAPLLLHLRWALGVLLMLLCGLGIAVLTGARRLETVRARRGAVLLSVAGPLMLWAGFLAVTY